MEILYVHKSSLERKYLDFISNVITVLHKQRNYYFLNINLKRRYYKREKRCGIDFSNKLLM